MSFISVIKEEEGQEKESMFPPSPQQQSSATATMNIPVFPVKTLIKIIANLLESMIQANNQIPNTQITCFHSRAIPNISILSYLTRIHKFTPFTNEALLSTLIYFDRISNQQDGITINSFNIHRLLITSITVASKFTSDVYYTNSRYAKVGGLSLYELNQLELELLFLIDFQLHITLETLQTYANQLMSHAVVSCSTMDCIGSVMANNLYQHPAPSSVSANKAVDLPLTPPYNPPIEEETRPSLSHTKKHSHIQQFHPYQNHQEKKKRRLHQHQDQTILVSPKEA